MNVKKAMKPSCLTLGHYDLDRAKRLGAERLLSFPSSAHAFKCETCLCGVVGLLVALVCFCVDSFIGKWLDGAGVSEGCLMFPRYLGLLMVFASLFLMMIVDDGCWFFLCFFYRSSTNILCFVLLMSQLESLFWDLPSFKSMISEV